MTISNYLMRFKIILPIATTLILTGCTIKLGEPKPGGVIEYMEKNYTTDARTPGASRVTLAVSPTLLPNVQQYCRNQGAQIIDAKCVTPDQKILFITSHAPSLEVPVYVNNMVITNRTPPLLLIHESKKDTPYTDWEAYVKEVESPSLF
ncbi:hypothetical protein Xekj_02509 [Xenorhabdus sp. KJ12.1]|nr:hypothetical protein Xekj_02509 [Xenorhabdus sp. KJ12.1]